MASLSLKHIYKVYPNGFKAVNDFSMDIQDKEFIVFVGPSGCGKSTTLRMIAGLEDITAGELRIDNEVVNDVQPKDRDIAMVFQNYALYPHYTVYENMAFGLRMRHIDKQEIDRKVREAAEILGITEYLNKKPKEMSGGQRQRVALGRAIVREPKVFLLDEPLSNLDAKLRSSMRSEISKLHQKIQTTFIYVTHDQVEAMTMGTRIVVMKEGVIQQIDTPHNLYNYPVNKFVAGFIGTPQMNFYTVNLLRKGDKVDIIFRDTDLTIEVPFSYFVKTDISYLNGKKSVVLGIRPDDMSSKEGRYSFKVPCKVSYVEELGADSQVYGDLDLTKEATVTESPTRAVIKAPSAAGYRPGQIIDVYINLDRMHLFDAENEKTISPRTPDKCTVHAEIVGGKLMALGNEMVLPPALDLPDGKYDIRIPSEAIIAGDYPAEVVERQVINNIAYTGIKLGESYLYIEDFDVKIPDGKVGIDLKKIVFIQNGLVVVPALQSDNMVEAMLAKEKIKDRKEAKKNGDSYLLNIGDVSLKCPSAMADEMMSAVGKDIFRIPLELHFAPKDAVVREVSDPNPGIICEVKKVIDYGKEKYLKLKYAGKDIVVAVDEVPDSKSVKLELNVNKLTIIETARSIRLI